MSDGASRTEQPVAPRGGLLVVHAHPDDETLTNGALLATWAREGERTAVVTCTRGERGEVIGAELAHLEGDGPALAAHRTRELASALRALGVHQHYFLDGGAGALRTASDVARAGDRYEDSGMAWVAPGVADRGGQIPPGAFVAVPVDVAAARLAHVIETERPAVVVTYEPGGGYGHPDHVRAQEVVDRALRMLPEESRPDLWWTVAPRSALRAARTELAADAARHPARLGRSGPLTAPDPEGELPSVAVPDARARDARTVLVRPVLDAVLAALRAHSTQIQAVRAIDGTFLVARYALSNDVLAPILPLEYYVAADTPGAR